MIFISQDDGVIQPVAPATDDVEVLVTLPPVLVTGATGRVGRVVVDILIDAGVPVRALTHRSESAAMLFCPSSS
jgi:hypothetical protein